MSNTKVKLTQNQIAYRALSKAKSGVTASGLAAKGIANPRAVISALRSEGIEIKSTATKKRAGSVGRPAVRYSL